MYVRGIAGVHISRCFDATKNAYPNMSSMNLHSKQIAIMEQVLRKKNTFAFLPTGFGKSMAYILPPLIMDQVSVICVYFSLCV